MVVKLPLLCTYELVLNFGFPLTTAVAELKNTFELAAPWLLVHVYTSPTIQILKHDLSEISFKYNVLVTDLV